MAWYVGRHEKDTDERYNAAVGNANTLLACLGLVALAAVIAIAGFWAFAQYAVTVPQ